MFNTYNCRAGEELCWCYAFIGEKVRVRVDSLPSADTSPPGSPLEKEGEEERCELGVPSETPEPSAQAQIQFSAAQFDEVATVTRWNTLTNQEE